MTATLTFDLPDEATLHQWAVSSADMAMAINDFMNQTRSWLKHGHDFTTPAQAIEACRSLMADVSQVAAGEI